VLSIYSKEVHRILLFRECEENFIVQLIIAAKPFQALPGTKIVLKGDVADEVMFLMRGVVQFTTVGYTEDEGVVDAVTGYSTEGGYFGDFEYYKRTIRLVTHRAMCNCSIMSIPTSVIDTALSRYPVTGEKIFGFELERRYQNFLTASQSEAVKQEGYRYYIKEILTVDGTLSPSHNHSDLSNIFSKRFTSSHTHTHSNSGAVLDVIRVIHEIKDPLTGKIIETHGEEHPEDITSRYLILPKSSKKISWDLFIGLLILYSVLIIPVQIGFDVPPSEGGLQVFDQIVDIFFGIDILISMRTCYFDEVEDAYVTLPKKIYRHYLLTWFSIDFFSVMPFDLLLAGSGLGNSEVLGSLKLLKVIRLVRLLKLFRLMKLRKYLIRIEESLGINPATFELVKILLEVSFIGHLTSCVYWYLSANLSDYAWFDKLDLRHASLANRYITTLYWTFTTLSTVGYGDITPVDTSGQVVSTMIMILGGTVFGYIVANVSGLMSSLDVTSSRVNERIAEVTEYLTEKNASSLLSESIVKHVRYMFTQSSVFDERAIISRLPLHLSRQMIFCHHSETFAHILLFRFIESKGVILFLFKLMTPVFYEAKNFISVEGTVANELVFLVSGRAHVYKARVQHQFLERRGGGTGGAGGGAGGGGAAAARRLNHHRTSSNTALTTAVPLEMCDRVGYLSSGDFFGYVSMMLKKPYQASIRTSCPCSVYSLHTHDISALIRDYPAVAMTLQNAIAHAVHYRTTRGNYERRRKRAHFIEEMARLYVSKAAMAAAAAKAKAAATAGAGLGTLKKAPSILSLFPSRSFKNIRSSLSSRDSRDTQQQQQPSPVSASSPAASAVAAAAALAFEPISEHTTSAETAGAAPAALVGSLPSGGNQRKYTTSQVVPMDHELPELDSFAPHTASRAGSGSRPEPGTGVEAARPGRTQNPMSRNVSSSKTAQGKGKERWQMLRAVVHDSTAMALVQESFGSSRGEEEEEMKTPGGRAGRGVRGSGEMDSSSVAGSSEELKTHLKQRKLKHKRRNAIGLFNQRSMSIASVVRASIATKRRQQNVMTLLLGDGDGDGNEQLYDSEEDRKLYDEFYFIKTKALRRTHHSCPNISGIVTAAAVATRGGTGGGTGQRAVGAAGRIPSRTLQRRMSYPMLLGDQERWQESQQSQHLV
jgi:CRP-like cAMP-binding protein